jgi:hypothetical protein
MNNVAPGDLAWVVSKEVPENTGKVVKVLTGARYVIDPDKQWWHCQCEHDTMTIDLMGSEGVTYQGHFADVADQDLKKIAGPGVLTEDSRIYRDLNSSVDCGER